MNEIKTEKTDIKSLNIYELRRELAEMELQKFRADQIYKWLQVQGVESFFEMSNIPKDLKEKLNEKFVIKGCKIEKKLVSEIDGTVKYLFRLYDGEFVESVLMKYKYGYSLCVSSQVGCNMGCKFCASTLSGCVRNLSAAEILSQIHSAQRDMGIRVSHIVLMGMGEPLDNFENVMKFAALATDENGLNLSMRNISLSTCGIVPKIGELMKKHLPLTLSVSLHAPNDKIRSQIMPVNKKWGVNELLNVCHKYALQTSRRISFEYAMIDGVNDSDRCAHELGEELKGMLCHVNIIPINNVKENTYKKSSRQRIEKFISILSRYGVNATVRRTLGADINASCGQLRRSHQEQRRS